MLVDLLIKKTIFFRQKFKYKNNDDKSKYGSYDVGRSIRFRYKRRMGTPCATITLYSN